MTNSSWKINNHGFDFRKRRTILHFRKRKHCLVISQLPDRLWGLISSYWIGTKCFLRWE